MSALAPRASLPIVMSNAVKASPSDVRRKNRALIFSLLFPDHQYSRAELGRLTGLSRVAVSDVISDMIDEGLVVEGGTESSASGKGKPATLLVLDTTRTRTISIDLSQDQLIQCAATDILGRPSHRMEVTLGPDNKVNLDAIVQLVEQMRAELPDDHDIIGIGVACPGALKDGVVLESTQLGWKNVDLAALLESRFHIPVTLVNDSVAAMTAERYFGQAGPNLLFVKNDKGIGSAVLINDEAVIGDNHAAGEIGHISLDPVNGPLCPCGKRGCMEMLLSASALREQLHDLDSIQQRTQIVADAGRQFASALAMPIGLLDISDVCVYGPADIINTTFLETAQEQFDAMARSQFHARTVIRRCQLGADISLRGAAIEAVRAYIVH
ncbi:NagC family transcriptional regulator [Bifidobacterium dolichotidis]|uniref:NagC family transcriptional regulator n=1 Tax=Bifidobacterium dolichotidis TaxID=2306976 RepID=A0A430FPP6_9BIFI|nr:ROK family transcriptional regulator [Bifidobacterium dolichotidis]RSX54785.1 NagC family transcriptional regulator [Bifidobacterium dolichotidis]